MRKALTISQTLGRWISETTVAEIPDVVISDAIWRVIDQVGICIAGSGDENARAVRDVARELGSQERSTTFVFGDRFSAPMAGCVNGASGTALDYDDLHPESAVHISSVAVPAALALGEDRNANGEQMLLALALGAEVGIRVMVGAPPHQFHRRGIHATGTGGPFAAAAIGAKLLGLNAEQCANALGLAGSRSSGFLQGLVDGSSVKILHPGWAVEGGLTVALLAQKGYTGPAEVIEGKLGLYHAFLAGDENTFHLERICDGLGMRWLLPETEVKTWPNCAWNHSSLDGVAEIVRKNGLVYRDVERVDCFVPAPCIPLVCEPRETKLNPQTTYHMKFSLPYSLAMLLVKGDISVNDYNDEVLADPIVHEYASRVLRSRPFDAAGSLTWACRAYHRRRTNLCAEHAGQWPKR